jgi:hypothetical protein
MTRLGFGRDRPGAVVILGPERPAGMDGQHLGGGVGQAVKKDAGGAPVSPDYGSRGNGFNGRVKGVQLAIADATENLDYLVSPEDAIRIAMARQ